MIWLTAGLAGLGLFLAIYELINWQSSALLVIQLVVAVLVPGVALLTMQGIRLRWLFFAVLLIAGLIAFYMGGSRMGNFEQGEVYMISYVSVAAGLAYLLSAIYAVYSPEIGVFLKDKQHRRKNSRQQSK